MIKYLVLPDIHCPDEDKKSLRNVLDYVHDSRPWDGVILLGDVLDLGCISSHNKNNLRAVEATRISKDFEAGRKLLKDISNAIGEDEVHKPKKFYLEGNHEYRLARLINAQPQLEGAIDIEKDLRLAETNWKYIHSWSKGEVLSVGKASFIHGTYHDEFHAKQHVMKYGKNIFYGHLHSTDEYPLCTLGDNKTRVGKSLGCLCNYRPYYLKGRPNRWQQAFAEFIFRKDGYFNYFVTHIFNHKFVGRNDKYYGK